MLHADSTKTPYEIVIGFKPMISLLKTFGAKAYLFNPLHRKDLSPRGIVGYHMGISPDSKGWVFWIPEKGNFFMRSASVKFDENSFYDALKNQIISSIQASNLFDHSMMTEIETQDSLICSLNNSSDLCNIIPTSLKEISSSPDKLLWEQAMNEEILSMKEEDVFELTNLSTVLQTQKHSDILSSKWVFAKKNAPIQYMARLVARGFRQTKGINFEETFGALRLLLSLAISNKWSIKTFDVKVAFLHSLIDMPIFIWPPQGMAVERGKVLKLKKALYGTKQAARCWWRHLTKVLENIGFRPNKEDLSTYTFISDAGSAILWIHVDDGAITSSSNELLSHICGQLDNALKIKWDDGIGGLVGLKITPHPRGLHISQPDLINKLTHLSCSNITAKSPLPQNCNLTSNKAKLMDIPYLKQIGILLYIAQGSRPDITYAVNYLARFSLGTDESHWQALEHLIAYLRYTINIGIYITDGHPGSKMECYVDANWGERILSPEVDEVAIVGHESKSFTVRLDDSIMKNVQFSKVEGYRIAYKQKLHKQIESLLNVAEHKPNQDAGLSKTPLKVLEPLKALSPASFPFIGNFTLGALKARLEELDIPSRFVAGGVLVCGPASMRHYKKMMQTKLIHIPQVDLPLQIITVLPCGIYPKSSLTLFQDLELPAPYRLTLLDAACLAEKTVWCCPSSASSSKLTFLFHSNSHPILFSYLKDATQLDYTYQPVIHSRNRRRMVPSPPSSYSGLNSGMYKTTHHASES
ncbi:hypothetical protein O181_002320 [Austropuccinia psidii MF-1]|uniref:Cleavage and polyadenylation specificity factor subunit 2 n=1 Tax=Austropuccinia psidii MF-1 TaxID=1389203 RepID=A0A9Q3BC79_9BASI|nr:hypothetical protein [Austropuccinia psidii MF-1]